MSVKFSCRQCGQRLAVGKHLCGKRGKCTKCGVILQIPNPSVPDPLDAVPGLGVSPKTSHQAFQSASPGKQTSSSHRRLIFLCSAAGGRLLVLVICAVLIFRLFRSEDEHTVASGAGAASLEPLDNQSDIANSDPNRLRVQSSQNNGSVLPEANTRKGPAALKQRDRREPNDVDLTALQQEDPITAFRQIVGCL